MKNCKRCLEFKESSEFYSKRRVCKRCYNDNSLAIYYANRDIILDKRKRSKNPEKVSAQNKKYADAYKEKVFNHYGSQCSSCGEDNKLCLSVDHVNNDGVDHRKSLTISIYRWLVNNGYPDGFQILCRNCNWLKHLNHQTSIKGELNPVQIRNQRYYFRLRNKVYGIYGNKCASCSIANLDVLNIDHVYGSGNKHRKGLQNSFLVWLRNKGYPDEFQLLCRNCNWLKWIKGRDALSKI